MMKCQSKYASKTELADKQFSEMNVTGCFMFLLVKLYLCKSDYSFKHIYSWSNTVIIYVYLFIVCRGYVNVIVKQIANMVLPK